MTDTLLLSSDGFLSTKTEARDKIAISFLLFNAGGKYFYTTNNSTLVAFIVGGKFKAGNGFKVICGHTGMCNALRLLASIFVLQWPLNNVYSYE